jgi:NAD(P)-dependent dehydrogenase (short-subunit alcohol dehydrogenase family)
MHIVRKGDFAMAPRTIVITGTNSGFGKALVERFAAAGWNVAATVRRPEEHSGLFAELPNVRLFPLDVTDQAQVDQFAMSVHAAYGAVDVLVNNAGYFLMGPLETNTMEQIRDQYETNVFGLIMVTRAFLPRMRERRAGMIINIASSSAKANYPFAGAYGSSKWAVAGLTEALAIELAPFNIKVKNVFPGAHATRIFTKIRNGVDTEGAGSAAAAYRPYIENFFATQEGVPHISSPRNVAEVVYRAVRANDDQTDYVAGRDAKFLVLMKRILPQWAFKRMQVASILQPPSPITLRFLQWVMRGTERVEVDRGSISPAA